MADSDKQIGFEQLGIGSVLSRNTLIVPPNQREYSWTDREVWGLFTDIARAMQATASADYFLGSIVTIPVRPGVLEVVDGQQRLATTAILLAAIRHHLDGRESDKLIVERIDNQFLTTIDSRARERVSRLRLNTTDSSYFDRRVLKNETGAPMLARSHRLINDAATKAAEYVKGIVRQFEIKDHGDILNNWVEFLEHRAIAILLKVPSAVNAYKMFETLNDRGLRTSQADLVKNYLFGESGDRLVEAQQKWTSMKAVLESLEDDDITITFLRQMLISMYGHVRDSEVYDTVQKNAKGVMGSLSFLTQLESGAGDYVAILSPDSEKWNRYPANTRRALEALALLRIKPVRPVLLSLARAFAVNEADTAFQYFLNLAVRIMIVGGGRSGSVEESFAAVAQMVSDRKISTSKEVSAQLSKIAPTDTEFEERFRVATISQAYLARYFLRSLEMCVKQQAFPFFIPNDDQQVINLEHVLPEKPMSNWPQFTPDDASSLWRRLGNMALLQAKGNSDLRSAGFDDKKTVYATCPYELTSQIAQVPTWDAAAISARQTKLAALAVKTWPVRR